MGMTNKAFSEIFSFTRASSATRINAQGLIESVAANVPRFDYDPVTLQPKGLLIEEQRTNLQTSSNSAANMSPSAGGLGTISKTENYAVSPDGTQNATRFLMNLNGGSALSDICSVAMPGVSITSGIQYTGTVYVKSNTASSYTMNFLNPDGTVTQSVVVTPSWTRVTCTSTSSSTASGNMRLRIRGGEGTSSAADISVFGWQLEPGAFATSYIPTTTAQVTRAADVCSINTLSPWYNQSEWTIYCEYLLTGKGGTLLAFDAGDVSDSGNNFVAVAITGSGANVQPTVKTNGAVEAYSIQSINQSAVNKLAFVTKANDFISATNGVLGAQDSAVSLPTSQNRLRFCASYNYSQGSGYIRKLKYFPKRLTNAELQALTA